MVAFIAKPATHSVRESHKIFFSFRFHGAFLPQFAHTGCNGFITIFRDSKTDFPGHGKAMRGEVGVIKPANTGDRFSPLKPTRYEGG